MKIEARFRRRAQASESIADLNSQLLVRLSRISALWRSDQSIANVHFDAGTGESAAADLSACLENGIDGAISYASRLPGSIVDRAVSDDCLTLVLDIGAVNFKVFCRTTFPEIVKAFDAYRASSVTDLDNDLEDFDGIVKEAQQTGRDIDGRDTVFRINAINFFDNTMCLRAFGISSSEVVEKLYGSIEWAENFHSGVLMRTSEEPVVGAQLLANDDRVRQLLRE